MTVVNISSHVARLLFEAGAVHVNRTQPFILAAGWASPVYIDARILFGDPHIRCAVIDQAVNYAELEFNRCHFDAVAGAETAGIPFASLYADRARLRLRYVRKRPLGIGRNAQVEGGDVDGLNVLLIDDLTTDGASKLSFARGLRAAGATVEHVLTVFYHGVFPRSEQRMAEANLELHALATWSDVLANDDSNYLSREDRVEIEDFLADPVSWSTRHGGRSSLGPQI